MLMLFTDDCWSCNKQSKQIALESWICQQIICSSTRGVKYACWLTTGTASTVGHLGTRAKFLAELSLHFMIIHLKRFTIWFEVQIIRDCKFCRHRDSDINTRISVIPAPCTIVILKTFAGWTSPILWYHWRASHLLPPDSRVKKHFMC